MPLHCFQVNSIRICCISTGEEDKSVKGYVPCQICQKDISGLSVDNRQRHLNMCMDGTVNVTMETSDEKLAQMLQMKEQDEVKAAATDGDEESYACQICQRDLSHLNSRRRAQHVNRCADKVRYI